VERRSPLLAGVALGAGVLVKYFHIVTAPALYKRWDWRLPVAFLATVTVLYLPYAGAGAKVFGFLGEYLSEEGFDEGSGIFLWQLVSAIVPLPEQAFVFYPVIAAAIMAVLAVGVLMRAEPGADLAGAMLLATAFLILLSPHYPWYFAWLVPFLCFYPVVGVVYLTCAAGILYFARSPPTLWEALPIYGPCILILVAEFALRSRRKPEERHGDAVPA
jgi:alpha-1,6-mannosyltransferase